MYSREDLIYLAGFFDGEGSVYISKTKKSFKPTCSIGNTNKEVIFWIRETIGYGLVRERKKSGNRKVAWDFTLTNLRDNIRFLSLIYPYLKIKRTQATLVINYIEKRMARIRQGKEKVFSRANPYNKEELRIISEVKELNKRGKDGNL